MKLTEHVYSIQYGIAFSSIMSAHIQGHIQRGESVNWCRVLNVAQELADETMKSIMAHEMPKGLEPDSPQGKPWMNLLADPKFLEDLRKAINPVVGSQAVGRSVPYPFSDASAEEALKRGGYAPTPPSRPLKEPPKMPLLPNSEVHWVMLDGDPQPWTRVRIRNTLHVIEKRNEYIADLQKRITQFEADKQILQNNVKDLDEEYKKLIERLAEPNKTIMVTNGEVWTLAKIEQLEADKKSLSNEHERCKKQNAELKEIEADLREQLEDALSREAALLKKLDLIKDPRLEGNSRLGTGPLVKNLDEPGTNPCAPLHTI